jgi:hypothetical protein
MDSLQLTNLGTGVIVTANTPAANISLIRSEVGFTSLASTMWSGGKYSPASLFAVGNARMQFQQSSRLLRGADFPVVNMYVWQSGDRAKLTPSGLLAENNRFHDFGRWTCPL